MFSFIKRLLGIPTKTTQKDRFDAVRHDDHQRSAKPQKTFRGSDKEFTLSLSRNVEDESLSTIRPVKKMPVAQKAHVKRTIMRVRGDWPELETSIQPDKTGALSQRLLSVAGDAELKITPHTERDGYTLKSLELNGVDSKFDDEDFTEEVILGIDFGTSNLKAIVHTGQHDHCLAVPFRDLKGINAYLLPTVLYLRDDSSFTLEPTDKIAHASLKLALMANSQDPKIRALTVAYLALAIRHIRAWLFDRYKEEFADAGIAWEMRIGCPSNKDQDDIVNLWHELLARAWILSEKSGYLTDSLVASVMRHDVLNDDIADYCRAYPEVFAAGQGYRKIYPPEVRYMTDIIIVDIGSGTVDISAFALSDLWGDQRTRIGIFCCEVKPLGTSKYYETQLTYLRNLFQEAIENKAFPVNASRLRAFVKLLSHEIGQALREPLRDSFKDHCVGFSFSKPTKTTPEQNFANEVRKHLLRIRRGTKNTECLTRDQVSRMEVVLTGGGSRSNFYTNAFLMDDGKMYRNTEWLSPKWINFKRIDDIPDIREQLEIPISNKDYDRLLVAFGLQISDLGESFVPSKADPVTQRDWGQGYIDKSQV